MKVGYQGDVIFDYKIDIYCVRSWKEWQGGENCDSEEYIDQQDGPEINDDFHLKNIDVTQQISWGDIGGAIFPEASSSFLAGLDIILDTLDMLWGTFKATYQAVKEAFDTADYIATVVEGVAWSCSDPCDK